MCPSYLASDRQALCLCHPDGLMCPSANERESLCGARFPSCPIYAALRCDGEPSSHPRPRPSGLDRREAAWGGARAMEVVT